MGEQDILSLSRVKKDEKHMASVWREFHRKSAKVQKERGRLSGSLEGRRLPLLEMISSPGQILSDDAWAAISTIWTLIFWVFLIPMKPAASHLDALG